MPIVVAKGERITRDFVEVNSDGTIMKENGIVIKNGKMGKVDKNGVFEEIPPPVYTGWNLFRTQVVHQFIEVYPEYTFLKERHSEPLIDDLLYFKLYNMSKDEVEENKKNEKIARGFKAIEGPRKAVINGYDSIYDYDTSRYITTRPRVDDLLYFELYNMSEDEIEKNKKRKAVINGYDSIYDYDTSRYITTRPRVDDALYFKLYNMSNEEIRKQKEKIADRLPPSPKKVLRKAVINGKDSIFDYEKFEYITTGPKEPQFNKAGTYYDDLLKKYKKYEIYKRYEKYKTYTENPEKYEKYEEYEKDKKKYTENPEKYKKYEEYEEYKRYEKYKTYTENPEKYEEYEKDKKKYTENPEKYEKYTENPENPEKYEEYEEYKEYKPFLLDERESIFANRKDQDLMYVTKTPKPMSGGGNKSLSHDYEELFEMEPEPVMTDYTDLFEMEPEPVMTDYTELFEMEPEPVMTDYTDLFETEPEPVMTDYTELFETEPEPVMTDYTELFETEPEPVMTDYTELFETEPEPVVVVVASVEDCTDLFE
jgi:hypothetical protein